MNDTVPDTIDLREDNSTEDSRNKRVESVGSNKQNENCFSTS